MKSFGIKLYKRNGLKGHSFILEVPLENRFSFSIINMPILSASQTIILENHGAQNVELPSAVNLLENHEARHVELPSTVNDWHNVRVTASTRTMSSSSASQTTILENHEPQHIELLTADTDRHKGVTVNMKGPMDSKVFASMLRKSLSYWRQRGHTGVWIKLPIELANLVEPAVQQGFRYHHAEPDYLMLVLWIPETPDAIPLNASHRVRIISFVMNDKREVLVVLESKGRFRGTWKLPTGVVSEGEDICTSAVREVKEETGIDTEFVEVLAFRQSHKSFFQKTDLFFVCKLRPLSFDIQRQDSEIEAAQWMAAEDYASQTFVGVHEMFKDIAKICLTKSEKDSSGFSPVPSTSSSGKISYLYFNNRDCDL